MAAPPRFKNFSREDFRGAPTWFDPLFATLNESLGGLVNAISGRLTRSENFLAGEHMDKTFTTAATVGATWPLAFRNALPTKPKHVWVTSLRRADGAALSAAYSMTWDLAGDGGLRLTFQGLDASTEYRASIAYE